MKDYGIMDFGGVISGDLGKSKYAVVYKVLS